MGQKDEMGFIFNKQ